MAAAAHGTPAQLHVRRVYIQNGHDDRARTHPLDLPGRRRDHRGVLDDRAHRAGRGADGTRGAGSDGEAVRSRWHSGSAPWRGPPWARCLCFVLGWWAARQAGRPLRAARRADRGGGGVPDRARGRLRSTGTSRLLRGRGADEAVRRPRRRPDGLAECPAGTRGHSPFSYKSPGRVGDISLFCSNAPRIPHCCKKRNVPDATRGTGRAESMRPNSLSRPGNFLFF